MRTLNFIIDIGESCSDNCNTTCRDSKCLEKNLWNCSALNASTLQGKRSICTCQQGEKLSFSRIHVEQERRRTWQMKGAQLLRCCYLTRWKQLSTCSASKTYRTS